MKGALPGHPRFRIGPALGRGGFGDVYLAQDTDLGIDVALKILREPRGTALLSLKREFHNLAHVMHEHLVTLYGLHEYEGIWFVAMQLVRGRSLRELLPHRTAEATLDLSTITASEAPPAAEEAHDPDRLVALLGQAAIGIEALHEFGLVHGDLKPTNLLVGDDGVLRIADFGLTAALGAHSSGQASYGTPIYAAPERIEGTAPAHSSDWYSFGVMLFEALTGRPPFSGSGVLEEKRDRVAPRVSEYTPVPPVLDQLVADLLDRVPQARPDGVAVLSALGLPHEPSVALRPVERPESLAEIVAEAKAVFVEGRPRRVDVVGASGLGKSPLLRSTARELDALGMTVLTTRCHAAVEVPHQALDGLIDQLALLLDGPRDLAALASLFPVLGDHAGEEPVRLGSERARRARAAQELAALLDDMGPTALIIDNAQWGDADSGILLARTLALGLPVLVVFGRRPGQHSPTAEAFDDGLPDLPAHEVELSPLTLTQAMAHAPDVAPDKLARFVDESGGNAFLLALLLARQGEAGVQAILDELVASLGEEARAQLEAVCTSPGPLSRRRLHALMGGRLDLEALLALRHKSLVHLLHDGAIEPYHARVLECVQLGLGEEGRKRWSRRHVDVLLAEEPVEHAALLRHLDILGERRTLASHAALAAEEAIEQHAPLQAARLWRWVLDHGELDDASRLDLLVRQAEAFSVAGRAQDAADAFLAASALAEESGPLRARAARALLNTGDARRGLPLLRELLDEVGVSWPGGTIASVARILTGRMRLTWLRNGFSEGPTSAEHALRIDILHAASTGLGLIDPMRGATLQVEYTVHALKGGDRRRAAQALFVDAAYTAVTGPVSWEQAITRHAEATEFAEPFGDDDYLTALSLMSRGLTAYLCARNVDSYELFCEAEDVYRTRCRDVIAEVSTASSLAAASLSLNDRWAELVEYIQPRLQEALNDDNIQLSSILGSLQASRTLLLANRLDAAWARLKLVRKRLEGVGAFVLEERANDAECDLRVYGGDARGAYELWARSVEQMRKAGLLRLYIRNVRSHYRLGMLAVAAGEHAAARSALQKTRAPGGSLAHGLADVLAGRIALATDAADLRPRLGAAEQAARGLHRPLLEGIIAAHLGALDGRKEARTEAEAKLRAQGAVDPQPWFAVIF